MLNFTSSETKISLCKSVTTYAKSLFSQTAGSSRLQVKDFYFLIINLRLIAEIIVVLMHLVLINLKQLLKSLSIRKYFQMFVKTLNRLSS